MTDVDLVALKRRVVAEQRAIAADLAENVDVVLDAREDCFSCRWLRRSDACQLLAGWDAQSVLDVAAYREMSSPGDVCPRWVEASKVEIATRKRRWAQTLRVATPKE